MDVYCDITPPPDISAGTATYQNDLYITDASATFVLQLNFGGEFTSTSSTECPISVFNANQAVEGYSTPSPF